MRCRRTAVDSSVQPTLVEQPAEQPEGPAAGVEEVEGLAVHQRSAELASAQDTHTNTTSSGDAVAPYRWCRTAGNAILLRFF